MIKGDVSIVGFPTGPQTALGVLNAQINSSLPLSIGGQWVFGSGVALPFYGAGTYLFTVPIGVTKIRVRLLGAAGSGAAAATSQTNATALATGGNSGSFVVAVLNVQPLQTYIITIGAGGASVTATAIAAGVTALNGVSGGTTSFGTLFSAPGGQGGVAIANASTSNITATPNPAATPTSGMLLLSGGQSGSASRTASVSTVVLATGGAGPATILGPGRSSGSASSSFVATIATGGASATVAGTSGTATNGSSTATGGSGVAGPGLAINASTTNAGGADSSGAQSTTTGANNPLNSFMRFLGDIFTGGGGAASSTTGNAGGLGGGGGAGLTSGGAGGPFGGGGAAANTLSTAGTTTGGKGGIGGGGGGAAIEDTAQANTVNAISGTGGDGFALVEF